MGRPGGGGGGHSSGSHHVGGGGGHSSGSHHVGGGGHSSGSHHVGGGGGSFRHSGGGGSFRHGGGGDPMFGGPMFGGPGGPRRRGPIYGGPIFGGGCSGIGCFTVIFILVISIIISSCEAFFDPMDNGYGYVDDYGGGIPASTTTRTKIDNPNAYNSDCIIDQEDWFVNVSSTEKQLETFYNETGVQPYIVIFSYNKEYATEDEQQEYGDEWYDEHITDDDTFVYMYFADKDPDEVGCMWYYRGDEAATVMDDEAVNIFWAYIDEYWYDDLSSDQMFAKAFNNTASDIMGSPKEANKYNDEEIVTSSTDYTTVLIVLIVALAVIIVLALLIRFYRMRAARKAQEAKETADILNADLDKMAEDIADKYEQNTNYKQL